METNFEYTAYDFAEVIGREKALSVLGDKQHLVNVEDRYAPFDLSGTTISNRNIYIEIKDRKCKSNAYDTDILEEKKIKRMQKADPKGVFYYFCSFSDGLARLYNLNKLKVTDVTTTIYNCPSSTVEDKGMIQKICYQLPNKLATTYKL